MDDLEYEQPHASYEQYHTDPHTWETSSHQVERVETSVMDVHAFSLRQHTHAEDLDMQTANVIMDIHTFLLDIYWRKWLLIKICLVVLYTFLFALGIAVVTILFSYMK